MKIRELFFENANQLSVGEIEINGNKVAPNGVQRDIWEYGNFDCSDFNLTSLIGAPKELKGGHFFCNNNKLTSLEGAPQKQIYDFFCDENDLTSLEGCPQKITGTFDCSSNKRLTSLKGMSQEGVTELFCSDCDLESLEGAPDKINGALHCANNSNLKNLIGCPQGIESLICHSCGFSSVSSLEGMPKIIKKNLTIYNNPIKSLKGIHKIVEEIGNKLMLPFHIESNILGVLKIKNLKEIVFYDTKNEFSIEAKDKINKVAEIVNTYLPNPTTAQILDCQNELIEAGYEEYAEL